MQKAETNNNPEKPDSKSRTRPNTSLLSGFPIFPIHSVKSEISFSIIGIFAGLINTANSISIDEPISIGIIG